MPQWTQQFVFFSSRCVCIIHHSPSLLRVLECSFTPCIRRNSPGANRLAVRKTCSFATFRGRGERAVRGGRSRPATSLTSRVSGLLRAQAIIISELCVCVCNDEWTAQFHTLHWEVKPWPWWMARVSHNSWNILCNVSKAWRMTQNRVCLHVRSARVLT